MDNQSRIEIYNAKGEKVRTISATEGFQFTGSGDSGGLALSLDNDLYGWHQVNLYLAPLPAPSPSPKELRAKELEELLAPFGPSTLRSQLIRRIEGVLTKHPDQPGK